MFFPLLLIDINEIQIKQQPIFIIVINQMEQERLNNRFKSLLQALPQSTLVTITQFLDDESLEHLKNIYLGQNCQNGTFPSLVNAQLFIRKYINSFDRSLYFSLYSETQFIRRDQEHISGLSISLHKQLNMYYYRFQQLFKSFRFALHEVDKSQQIIESLKYALQNPDLPFPKMRREGIGMFCNSHFQYYLVDLKFGIQEEIYLEQAFEQLKILLQVKQQKYFNLQTMEADEDKLDIMTKVRAAPELINFDNFQQFLIKDQTLHNVIVFLVAMTQNSLQSIYNYIKSFHDPLRMFTELVVRYNIFRNFILSMEEKCSFLFQMYDKKYKDMFMTEQQYYPFCYWRLAFSIWYNKMKNLHENTNDIFCYLLTKVRYGAIINSCSEVLQEYKTQGQSIKNKLLLCQYEIKLKQVLFHQKNMPINSEVEQYFETDMELYQYLLREYLEYMIDISVNQTTVHWCGHSKQSLDAPYLNFQENFLQYTEEYHDYLKGIVHKTGVSPEVQQQILTLLLEQQINFIYDNSYAKPVTILKIIEKSQELMLEIRRQSIKQNSYKKEESLLMTKYSHNSVKSYSIRKDKANQKICKKLSESTKEKDNILTHYNTKHFENTTYQQHTKSGTNIPLNEQLSVSQNLRYSITLQPQQKISMVKSMNLHDISKKNKLKEAVNVAKKIKFQFDFVESQCQEMQIDERETSQHNFEYTQQELMQDYHDTKSQFGKVSLRIPQMKKLEDEKSEEE